MANRTFAIGDLHGDRDALFKLMSCLPPLDAEDTLLFLGDYIDRGPYSAQVLEYVRTLHRQTPARVVALRGNHEDAWLRVVERGWDAFVMPPGNGCLAAYRSFVGGPIPTEGEWPQQHEQTPLQTGSFLMPLVIMTAIPLTAIGILPGFWLLNLVVSSPAGAYATPVFFTATAMIGMIALGGIVVRNSIVLIEFIHDAQKEGMSLREAILDAGAVRFRPILLTAGTTALGAWPITFDPIFSGLAWALIFGLVASTLFTLVVIPVVYNLAYGNFDAPSPAAAEPAKAEEEQAE